MTRKTGRPTRCTPEVTTRVADGIRAGLFFEQACLLAGIPPANGYEWIRRGKGIHTERPTAPPFEQFAQAVERARADRERDALRMIEVAAKGGFVVERRSEERAGTTVETEKYAPPDWRAAAWWLERALPDRWKTANRTELTGADGGPVQVEHSESLSVHAARLHERLAASRPAELEDAVDAEIVEDA